MDVDNKKKMGRRPGKSNTRQRILIAAREAFSRDSYEGATIRQIAIAAEVDPALIIHFYESKQGLFAASMQLPFVPAEVFPALIKGDPQRLGERMTRFFLRTWEVGPARERLIGLIRSAVSEEAAAESLRGYVVEQVFGPLTRLLRLPQAELRASLISANLIGLAFGRYVMKDEQLAGATLEDLVVLVGPSVQALLLPTTSIPAASPGIPR